MMHKKKEGSHSEQFACSYRNDMNIKNNFKKLLLSCEFNKVFFKCLQWVSSVPLKNLYFAILKPCYDARNLDQKISGYPWGIKLWHNFKISLILKQVQNLLIYKKTQVKSFPPSAKEHRSGTPWMLNICQLETNVAKKLGPLSTKSLPVLHCK